MKAEGKFAGHFGAANEVRKIMDRDYESLRSEVLELDRESQTKLVEEIEQQWSADINDEAYAEAHRRLEAHRRGEGSYVTREESMELARQMIESAERSKK